ncbi:MAG: hypothetical protein IJ706_05595 [Clostridia bacterium]|nr:hypothetical protein [Clostridia bacterium]
MKTVDIDKLFEDYFRKFIAENTGKFSEDELEDKVSELYSAFGDEPNKELGGVSPRKYFGNMDGETLVLNLKEYVESNIPVSDYLCEALENKDGVDELLSKYATGDFNEEFSTYCINILNTRGYTAVHKAYVPIIAKCEKGENILELLTEILTDNADGVKEEILSCYADANGKAKSYLIEVLAATTPVDDRVFDILKGAFLSHDKEISLYVSYLTKYGDDRALPLFEDAVRKENISYADFKELKLGIEALGGECTVHRDFSKDKSFKAIKGIH